MFKYTRRWPFEIMHAIADYFPIYHGILMLVLRNHAMM